MKWDEIRIQTPYLSSKEINLEFFQKINKKDNIQGLKEARIISLFGRNGSGKPTISNALLNVQENNDSDKDNMPIFLLNQQTATGVSSAQIDLNHEIKQEIYVYNERFIDRYIRIKENENLQAIVMLSDNPNLQTKLTTLEKLKTETDIKILSLSEKLAAFEKKGNSLNERTIRSEIEEQLKEDGSWASIGKKIHSTNIKQKLDTSTFEKLRNTNITGGTLEIAKDLQQLLDKDLNKLDQIYNKERLPEFDTPTAIDQNNWNSIDNLLLTAIREPEFTGMESRIMQVLSQIGNDNIEKNKELFSDSKINYCPTCFRDINKEEKNEITNGIIQVLKLSKKEQSAELVHNIEIIELKKFSLIDNNSDYMSLFQNETHVYNKYILEYNKMVDEYSKKFDAKKDNPFSTIELPNYNKNILYSNIVSQAKKLHYLVEDYNSAFSDKDKIILEADLLNLHLAKFNTRHLFTQYENAVTYHKQLDSDQLQLNNELNETKQNILSTKLQLSKQKIALEQINISLAHVFMTHNRLKLIEGDNCYLVLSHGSPISLNQLSVGERNAISLCYFFSRINSNRSLLDSYKQNCLLVLDDPISSFDFENKIGVLSLIREELDQILLGNAESKILVMTHDAEMFRHFSKIYSDIEEKRSALSTVEKNSIPKIISRSNQLSSGELLDIGAKKLNSYAQQLQKVYDYASSPELPISNNTICNEDDLYIGNIMRRVLEAFSTFCYQKGISAVFNDPQIINKIPAEHRSFMSNFMYRLVFNSESHSEEAMLSRPDNNSVDFISHSELQKTGRLLLVFMNDLNSLHLEKNIHGFDSNQVKQWEKIAI